MPTVKTAKGVKKTPYAKAPAKSKPKALKRGVAPKRPAAKPVAKKAASKSTLRRLGKG